MTDVAPFVRGLREGRVVAAASESSFGFLADPRNPAALDRLARIKPRGTDKGLPLVAPSSVAAFALATEVPELARALARDFWPGPLTLVLACSGLDPRLTLDGTVAVRVPGDSSMATLTHAIGAPLTATSANHPSEPPLLAASDVRREFDAFVEAGDLVVVDGTAPGGPPSTIVVVGSRVRVVREGAVPGANVLAVVGAG